MPGELIDIFLKQSVTLIAGAVISYLLATINSKKKELAAKDAETESLKVGVQSLLRQEIIRGHAKYMALGYIPLIDKESLLLAYDSYHGLHKNGLIDGIMEDIRNLPVKENI